MGNKKLAVLFLHGMGNESLENFNKNCNEFKDAVAQKIGALNEQVHYEGIYYQQFLQTNQTKIWDSMNAETHVSWDMVRKFVLFGFGDAAVLETRASNTGSRYELVQSHIKNELNKVRQELFSPQSPIIIVAHSLGCQVISSYIWDAQSSLTKQGVWVSNPPKTPGNDLEEDFLRLRNLRVLYTAGCNIPIFVAGKDDVQAVYTHNSELGYDFNWFNFYDHDDVLGWPLKPLRELSSKDPNAFGISYADAVTKDIEINASGNSLKDFMLSNTPWSHVGYHNSGEFIQHVSDSIKGLLD